MITVLEWIFWGSAAAVVLIVIGYPAFLAVVRPAFRRERILDATERTVTLIIAAYNEERVIERKLENSLELDYPRDRLQIVVASDGSTDGTDEIVKRFADRGIQLQRFPRTGKTGMQNCMARIAGGEILVFSDSNAHYRNDAIRKLVRNFADPEIGGVCGQLVYRIESEGAGRSEGAYWNYEKFIKQRESDLSSVVGANGSIYAVRKSDYVDLDEDIISDLVEPLAVVRNGRRFIYEPEAVSVEFASENYGVEYRRKIRILTRAILGLLRMRVLMNPARFGIFAVQLVMHKFMRFLTPLFLMSSVLAFAGLAALGVFRWLFVALAALGVGALLVAHTVKPERPSIALRVCHLLYYYCMANWALVLAWFNILKGKRMTFWSPERTK